jgi:hypothetical protein
LSTVVDGGASPSHAAAGSGGLVINLIWDSNALSAPQSFRDGVQSGANLLEAAITDNITINISVGYGEDDGSTLSSGGASANIGYQGVEGAGV